MAIPKIDEQNITAAIKYIDEHGVPDKNKSTQYVLVMQDGKQYPPKYVIAVANHLANGVDIVTDGFNAVEAKNYFEARGYNIESKQEKYELTISSDEIVSTDTRFSIDNLHIGDNYKPIDTYFVKADGEKIKRKYNKGERRNTNQTLPRLAFQIFESQINNLSDLDKENFPICKYSPETDMICGIFKTVEEFLKYKNSMEHLTYRRENGPQYVIYAWNLFSTLFFVKECLKRFGNKGDKFILVYRDKTEQEKNQAVTDADVVAGEQKTAQGCKNPYSKVLLESKNIIFRGAPGTGKSYLAKEIAADIISDGYTDKYTDLSDEQKKQVEFVQFHPSYDYSDFVEGLRPRMNDDGSMGFELQDGIFKKFVDRARKNFEDSKKSKELVEQEISAKTAMTEFFGSIDLGEETFTTIKGSKFTIVNVDDRHIDISIPGNASIDKLSLNIEELQKMLESDVIFEKVSDVTNFFGKQFATQAYSYDFALYKAIKSRKIEKQRLAASPEIQKKYIFIIDEINRGEISKILGELFFAIDPGYRGKAGEVATQYSNMHTDPNEKFYIPENVYIIGTMNDIDRSVDSFDFAMRRRFRFVEVRAEDTQDMLESLDDEELKTEAIARMDKLNAEIISVPDLNENYQIGASYFLKLKVLDFDDLWTDYLQPLLQDYVCGLNDEEDCMRRFARAYGYRAHSEGNSDEAITN
ncbi:AAA family ATPase [Agathobacter sp.]